MSAKEVVFGFGAHSGIEDWPALLRTAEQGDRDRLDILAVSDHPYLGGRLDAYAALGFVLGRTRHLAGLACDEALSFRRADRQAGLAAAGIAGDGREKTHIP
jgi:hypothetical protein